MRKPTLTILAIILGVALAWAAPPTDKLPSLLTAPAEARITVIGGGSPPAPAGADYVLAKGFFYVRGSGDIQDTNFIIAVYNSSNSLIATSSTQTIGASTAWREVSFSSGPTITPGNTYRIGIFGDGYVDYFTDSESYQLRTLSVSSPPTPPSTINPTGDSEMTDGNFAIYVTNSSNQKLIGDNVTTGKTVEDSIDTTGNMVYKSSGYTADTL